jgi:hypothetical protein
MRIHKRFNPSCFAAALVIAYGAKALGAVSANATMTAVPDGANYDYTVTLHNTGTTSIESFWFAWLPGYDFLTSNPTITKTPTNWTTFIESGYYGGYSIEFYDTGTSSPLAAGQSSNLFQFTSADSPAVLAHNDPIFGAYATTYSFVYQGVAESSPGAVIPSIPITTVPEPTSFVLAAIAAALLLVWRNRAGRCSVRIS